MPRAPQTFKQGDLTRACKAVMAAGLKPKRAEIDRDGNLVLIFEGEVTSSPELAFDRWSAKQNAKKG